VIPPLAYGLATGAAFVAAALAYGLLAPRRNPPVPHLLAFWALGAALVVVEVLAGEATRTFALTLTNLALYLFLGELYIFVYAACVGSLSIRILVQTLELEPARDAFERAVEQHSPTAFFDVRLQSLLAQHLLVELRGRYQATAKGRRWAWWGLRLKRLLAVGTGG
jgi:hypothetical protein